MPEAVLRSCDTEVQTAPEVRPAGASRVVPVVSMDDAQQPLDPDVKEALLELQRYLSDSLAPLMVAESINLLLDHPANLAANEVQAWTVAQFRGRGANVPISDYLYHAVEKLHAMGHLRARPQGSAAPVPRRSRPAPPRVLSACRPRHPAPEPRPPRTDRERDRGPRGDAAPPGDERDRVGRRASGLRRAGDPSPSEHGVGPPTPLHAHRAPRAARRAARRGRARGRRPVRRRGTPQGRRPLRSRGGGGRGRGPGAIPYGALVQSPREALVAQILAVAAIAARSDGELGSALERLRAAGVDVPSGEVIRTLGRSIPPWPLSLPSEPVEEALSSARASATQAIRRVVTLPQDQEEVGKRFHEMVVAAVEQLNQGSLTRASRMFDVAEKLVVEKKVSPLSLDTTRRKAQDAVDLERVRSLGEDARNQQPLARILSFFPGFSIASLIKELRVEEKRERRRLLLALLEIHGPEARAAALDNPPPARRGRHARARLALQAEPPVPPAQDAAGGRPGAGRLELDAIIPFADPALPPPIVKEAIAGLAGIKHERSEAVSRHARAGPRDDAREEGRRPVRRGRAPAAARPRRRRAGAVRKRRRRGASSSSTASRGRAGSATPAPGSPSSRRRTSRTTPSS